MIKVGINGFGRIGSLAFRAAIQSDDIEVVAISAPGHPASHVAYCVKYDSVHGRFNGEVTSSDEDSTITVNGKVVKVLSDKTYRDATLIPWGELGVEYVLECTGVYLDKAKAQAHIDAGAKVVIMSGPAKDDTPMFVCGVNLDKYTDLNDMMTMINDLSNKNNVEVTADEGSGKALFDNWKQIDEIDIFTKAVVPAKYKSNMMETVAKTKQSIVENVKSTEDTLGKWVEGWRMKPELTREYRYRYVMPYSDEEIEEHLKKFKNIINR